MSGTACRTSSILGRGGIRKKVSPVRHGSGRERTCGLARRLRGNVLLHDKGEVTRGVRGGARSSFFKRGDREALTEGLVAE